MKPITNLAITGITKPKQMKKLAKLTNTPPLTWLSNYKNINGVVHSATGRENLLLGSIHHY